MIDDDIPPMRPVREDDLPPERRSARQTLMRIVIFLAVYAAGLAATRLLHIPDGVVVLASVVILGVIVLVAVVRLRRPMRHKPSEPDEPSD